MTGGGILKLRTDTNSEHDLHAFMRQVANEMAEEYQRIYAKSAEDPGTAGDEGEENWATVFREWLPPTYQVATKGRLIGADGRMSPQIDVLVLKPSYPRKLLEKKVWLADGVIAAFECKNTLTAAHVRSAVQRCVSFKSLFRSRQGTPYKEIRSPLRYGLLSHSHSWKGPRANPIKNIEKSLTAASAAISHPRDLLDLICVADLATWSSTWISSFAIEWQQTDPNQLKQMFGASRGPMTAHTCASFTSSNQTSVFQPVGALISELTTEIAWDDPSVRDIADYYKKTNLGGNSAGEMRGWPVTIFTEDVRRQIIAGRFTNGELWDEWSLGGP